MTAGVGGWLTLILTVLTLQCDMMDSDISSCFNASDSIIKTKVSFAKNYPFFSEIYLSYTFAALMLREYKTFSLHQLSVNDLKAV